MHSADVSRYQTMRYRRCGRSGVMLPEISLGLWHNFGGTDPFERSLQMVCHAFDHGITHFDLANNYGPPYGSAEETMGRILDKALRPYRDELFISTKAGYDMWPGPYGNWGSRKYLMASLDQSLRRMHLDYVDLFYSHRYDPDTPLDETLQALVDTVRMGKALYIGISRWPLEAAQHAYEYLAERDVPCLIFQDKYNIIDRAPARDGIIRQASEAGAGFISFSPLAQGLLSGRYLHGIPADSRMQKGNFLKADMLTPQLLELLRHLDALARECGMTPAQLALAWILADSRVTSVIVGASSVQQLAESIATIALPPLDTAVKEQIDRMMPRHNDTK